MILLEMVLKVVIGVMEVDKMADETCLKWGPELPFICLDFVQKTLSK